MESWPWGITILFPPPRLEDPDADAPSPLSACKQVRILDLDWQSRSRGLRLAWQQEPPPFPHRSVLARKTDIRIHALTRQEEEVHTSTVLYLSRSLGPLLPTVQAGIQVSKSSS